MYYGYVLYNIVNQPCIIRLINININVYIHISMFIFIYLYIIIIEWIGLQREFKHNISYYLSCQELYALEISHDYLANRLSATTSEKTILQYTRLFDHLIVASDLDVVDYMVTDCNMYESFTDLFELQKNFSPLYSTLNGIISF